MTWTPDDDSIYDENGVMKIDTDFTEEQLAAAVAELDAFMMAELDRQMADPNAPKPRKTNEEAWAEFVRCYMPIELKPSWHGEECPGNGKGEHECRCDECDHYLECFPDWKETMQQPY